MRQVLLIWAILGLFCAGGVTSATAADGIQLLYGFEDDGKFHVAKYATEGRQARVVSPLLGATEIRKWDYVISYCQGKFTGLTAQPPVGSMHDVKDWFFQRYGTFFDDALKHRYERRDWSAYDVIRFDAYAEGAPAIVGMRAFDASGPRVAAGYQGLRTGLVVFRIPQDEQVSCEFPLAQMARVAEMDLGKMMGFSLRLNGYEGDTVLYIDNVRLVSKVADRQDTKLPIVRMGNEVEPFKRPVFRKPIVRRAEKMKRETGPVERLGPITIDLAPYAQFSCYGGHFGGHGGTYGNTLRFAAVAYDNRRLCVLFGGATAPRRARGRKYGVFAAASFDGGATWGGLKPGDKEPVLLDKWYGRASGSADTTGDLYLVGTENCCSYHEGIDIFFRRLALTHEGWVEERMSLVDQNGRKCPCVNNAVRLPSGRIWVAWRDGFKGVLAKYSDDDGHTWMPCKDASHPVPRPFYEPKLADLRTPEVPQPPEAVLLWPGEMVAGTLLLPCGDGSVAALATQAGENDAKQPRWQRHDGTRWGSLGDLPWLPTSATVLERDHIFLAHGGNYHNLPDKQRPGPLQVAEFTNGNWHVTTLEEEEAVADAALTASGDAVFCFYIKLATADGRATYEVRSRRWQASRWGPSELVATETEMINHLAVPMKCPPSYAAVWWDQRVTDELRDRSSWIRFVRIPNR